MSLSAGLRWGLLAAFASRGAIVAAQQESCNTATNRTCWTDGFDITTDYEQAVPYKGQTKTVGAIKRHAALHSRGLSSH